jgi:hypothetical protein
MTIFVLNAKKQVNLFAAPIALEHIIIVSIAFLNNMRLKINMIINGYVKIVK